MLIEFHSADRMLGLKAVGIYQKGVEAASAACEKVYAPTLALEALGAEAGASGDWIAASLDEMGIGEVRELDMPHSSALALRTACSVYLAQLSKLTEKQADLLVPIDDTNELISRLQSLADRLGGQTELPVMDRVMNGVMDLAEEAAREYDGQDDTTCTLTDSSGRSVTMTGRQLARAAKGAGKTRR